MEMKTLNSVDAIQFCDKINLGDSNQIQPHGVLFALDRDLRVIQYSENASTFLDISVQDLLSQPVTHFLKMQYEKDGVANWLRHATSKYKRMTWHSGANAISVLAYVSHDQDGIILEIEKSTETHTEHDAIYDLTQYAISSMKNTMKYRDTEELARAACEEIQKITKYDRVIIYKFDRHDYSGTAIGEALNKNMDSYLGLRFPASDIPQSVREMYLKLPMRYIPSIFAEPVCIIPEVNPISNKPLNLSCVNLRMVTPVHLEYMMNRGVVSSASIAIIQDNKLWGLIACHHKKPKQLSLDLRLDLLLIANTLATQMSALESAIDYDEGQRTVDLQASLTANISRADSLGLALDKYHNQLMKLVSATGMSVYFHDILINYGVTPTDQEVLDLILWLQTKEPADTYVITSLPLEYEVSLSYKDKACGLLAMKITALQNHYLLFYRPERLEMVAWAGDPDRTLQCAPNSYSPRDSFDRFVQTVANQSSPWSKHDIRSADFIRSIVANKQLQDLLQSQAVHDPLTNLLNRLYLEQRLTLEIQRAAREHKSLTLILADLDFFKKVNDAFGHQAGDVVLKEFSKLLMTHFRRYDYIYRYGGEEFLILLPGVDHAAAKQKADLLRNETKKMKIIFNDITLPSLSVSLGISNYPENGFDARSLIAAADVALYQAKTNGRDQVVVAHAR